MDIISMIMSQNRGGKPLASAEKNEFTWDGNTSGKVSDQTQQFYKISDKTPDIKTLIRVKGILGGTDMELPKDALEIIDMGGSVAAALPNGGVIFAVIKDPSGVSDFTESGLYFARYDENNWAYCVEFTETIHPIDPKYIPGAVLPVVELTTEVSAADEGGTVLTADETAEVARVLSEYDYAIVKFIWGGKPALAVCMKTEVEGTHCLVGYFFAYTISLVILDGAGMAFLEPMT